MPDEIKILIGDYEYTRFKSYRIEHDIYNAAAAFDFNLYYDPNVSPRAGDTAKVYIDGSLELTGLIDCVNTSYDKDGILLKVIGRDFMGLVVDSFIERWTTFRRMSLKSLAEELLKNVPFINRTEITYDEAATRRDSQMPAVQTSPGQKIFDVLKDAALSRGLLFFAREDGGLCFHKPKGRGACVLNITRKTGQGNTYIIRGERADNISERFSKYTVITQGDGFFSDEGGRLNAVARREDSGMPFFKPFVESANNDTGSVAKRADALLEQRRAQSMTIKYTVKGHSQGAFPWAVNELVKVEDEILHINDTLLIYGRVFEMSKESGVITHLTLGEKGLVI